MAAKAKKTNGTKGTPKKRGAARDDARVKQKAAFLELIARGTVSDACKRLGLARTTAYRWRDDDPDFATAWDEAETALVESAEQELFRRAVDGWDEPQFYQGEECGYVRKFSDTCLIFFLKAHRPEKYREKQSMEHTGTIHTTIELPADFPEVGNAGDGDT